MQQSSDQSGKGVNKPIESFRHSFSSRELGMDHVTNELEHGEEVAWTFGANHLQGKCSDGFYSILKAENSSITCIECKKCAETAYELSPCSGDKDRVCFPDPVFYGATKTETNGEEDGDKGVVIETSANVFHEDLLDVRNLETTYYVTDTTQASDFYWDRESGLRVNIGIHNVHLLPAYKDFDHEDNSDNKFMSQNPDLLANQSFQAVTKTFCRYPVPDYYNLNLDVTANRTTKTETVQCSPENDFCRRGQHQRTLNSPCSDSQQQTHLVHQQQHPNSVVCVVESQLLSHVFKLRGGPDLPFGHFAKKCLLAHKKCNFCLESPRCKAALDEVEKLCCRSECLSSADCKFYYSNTCSHLTSSCATGPAYRYTIEPVYRSLENEFRCHLVHEHQPILYELFVFVQIPSMNFQTKKIIERIPSKDFQFNVKGTFQVDFLTIEHSSELDMAEELMLAGRTSHQKRLEFVVYPAKVALTNIPDYPVRYIKSNVWSTSMLPVKPFLYSTSTWNKESSSNCSKEVDKMAPLSSAPRIYHDVSDVFSLNESSFSRVNVLIQNVGPHFSYHIKHSSSPPFFRFIVPANSSILSYYSREFPGYLLRESLTASVGRREYHWIVSFSGRASSCPAFFETELNEGSLILPIVAKLDVLVLCPPKFNITFKIPLHHWESIQKRSITTFELQVKDSNKNFGFFLTHVDIEKSVADVNSTTQSEAEDMADLDYSHLLIWLVLLTGVLLTTSSFLCYVITLERRHFKEKYSAQHKKHSLKMTTCHACRPSNYSIHPPCKASPGFAEFLLLKTLYGVLFNFTAFFLTLHFLLLYDARQLNASVKNEEMKLKIFFDKLIRINEDNIEDEVRLYENMLACSRSATTPLRKAVDEIIHVEQLLRGSAERLTLLSVYARKVMNDGLHDFNESLVSHAKLQMRSFADIFETNTRNYLFILREKLSANGWFVSASKFFNLSSAFNCDVRMNKILLRSSPASKIYARDLCFYQFVHLEDLDPIKPWLSNMKNRLYRTWPSVVFKGLPRVSSDSEPRTEMKIGGRLEHFNALKFVVVQLKTKSKIRGVTKQTIFDEEIIKNNYEKIVIEDFLETPLNTRQMSRSFLYILESFDEMFLVQSTWIFCAVVDILIFIYRINHSFALAHSSRIDRDFYSSFSSNPHSLRNRRSGNYCYWTFIDKLDVLNQDGLKQAHNYISFTTSNEVVAKIESQRFLANSNQSEVVSVSTRVVLLVVSSSLRNQEISKIFLSLGLIVFLSCTFRILNEVVEDTKLLSIQRFICDLPENPSINLTYDYDDSFIISSLKHFEGILEMDFANVQNLVDFFKSSNDNLRQLFEADYPKTVLKKFPLVPCSSLVQNIREADQLLSMDCAEDDKSIREFNLLLGKVELFTSTFALLWIVGHFVFKTFLCRLRTSTSRQPVFQKEHYSSSNLQTFDKSKEIQSPRSPQAFCYGSSPQCSAGAVPLVKERIYTETKV